MRIEGRTLCIPLILAGLLVWLTAGCGGGVVEESAAHGDEDAHQEEHEHEHDHEGEEGHGISLEDLAGARCEHDTFTYQCNTCRYEIGVVELPRSLLAEDDEAEGGVVRTRVVGAHQVAPGLTLTGEVRLNDNRAVHISPRIPGIIETVHFDIGSRVEKDDVLFEIRSTELSRTLSDYERNQSMVRLAEKNLAREERLFEQKVASEGDLIEARMDYERHRTELNASEQALHVMGISDRQLEDLGRSGVETGTVTLPVRTPFAGRIIEKHVVVGELVSPGDSVMLLADLDEVWVWADIYEQDLPRLLEEEKKGAIPVEVRVRAFPDRAFPGTIDYVGAIMDETTRTVKVRATVDNSEALLRPGMFCELAVRVAGGEEVLAVPRSALLSDEGRDFVFVHWREDYYARRFITRGRDFFDEVEVLGGLDPGSVVVTDGSFLLKSDVLREKMGAGCAD